MISKVSVTRNSCDSAKGMQKPLLTAKLGGFLAQLRIELRSQELVADRESLFAK